MNARATTTRETRIEYEGRCAELMSWIAADPEVESFSQHFGFRPAPDGSHCFMPTQNGVPIHD